MLLESYPDLQHHAIDQTSHHHVLALLQPVAERLGLKGSRALSRIGEMEAYKVARGHSTPGKVSISMCSRT